jgi:hypothetical protein
LHATSFTLAAGTTMPAFLTTGIWVAGAAARLDQRDAAAQELGARIVFGFN